MAVRGSGSDGGGSAMRGPSDDAATPTATAAAARPRSGGGAPASPAGKGGSRGSKSAAGSDSGQSGASPKSAAAANAARDEKDARDYDDPLFYTDSFRINCFKVLPCSKRYTHDWSICPFAHASEKARRRPLTSVNYAPVMCPDVQRRGGDATACPRGDTCGYAHNIFELWLHPERYRVSLCRDGASCDRKICFFAHGAHELRVAPARLDARATAALDAASSTAALAAAAAGTAAAAQQGGGAAAVAAATRAAGGVQQQQQLLPPGLAAASAGFDAAAATHGGFTLMPPASAALPASSTGSPQPMTAAGPAGGVFWAPAASPVGSAGAASPAGGGHQLQQVYLLDRSSQLQASGPSFVTAQLQHQQLQHQQAQHQQAAQQQQQQQQQQAQLYFSAAAPRSSSGSGGPAGAAAWPQAGGDKVQALAAASPLGPGAILLETALGTQPAGPTQPAAGALCGRAGAAPAAWVASTAACGGSQQPPAGTYYLATAAAPGSNDALGVQQPPVSSGLVYVSVPPARLPPAAECTAAGGSLQQQAVAAWHAQQAAWHELQATRPSIAADFATAGGGAPAGAAQQVMFVVDHQQLQQQQQAFSLAPQHEAALTHHQAAAAGGSLMAAAAGDAAAWGAAAPAGAAAAAANSGLLPASLANWPPASPFQPAPQDCGSGPQSLVGLCVRL